jgi:hypothetical protein
MNALSAAMSSVLARIEPGWADGVALSRGLARYGRAEAFIGADLDSLSDCDPPANWDEERRALESALRMIQPQRKLAVLAMARDEALHLPEWIAHCLSIGVDHIFVYTNDNRDGTDDLLRWFSQNTPVTPLFTTAAPGIDIQRKNYQHAFFLLPELRLFDWVLVIDVDEFLVPASRYDHRLPTLLDAAPADAAAVVFPWLWRLWDRSFERTPGLLAERYGHALPHSLCKSAVRLRHATSLCEIHIPTLNEGKTLLDSSLAPIKAEDIWANTGKSTEGGWIDHYWGRSFEEFIIKKIRGDSLAIPNGQFQSAYETFFSWTAALSEENRSPVPVPIIASIQAKLAQFSRDPVFREVTAKALAFYDEHAAKLKEDANLIALYQAMRRDIVPSLVGAP